MSYNDKDCEAPTPRDPVDLLARAANRIANAAEQSNALLNQSLYGDKNAETVGYIRSGQGANLANGVGAGTIRRKGVPSRNVQTNAANFGEVGAVISDEFTSRDGTHLSAHRVTNEDDLGAFSLTLNSVYANSPMGLRELACELVMLADQLDGCETTFQLLTPATKEAAAGVLTPAQIRGRKSAVTRKRNAAARAAAAKPTTVKKTKGKAGKHAKR